MWYEILPAAGVIFGAMAFAQLGPTLVAKLAWDKPSGFRKVMQPYEHEYWKRDYSLTGSVYKLNGLETIPDEGATSFSSKK